MTVCLLEGAADRKGITIETEGEGVKYEWKELPAAGNNSSILVLSHCPDFKMFLSLRYVKVDF